MPQLSCSSWLLRPRLLLVVALLGVSATDCCLLHRPRHALLLMALNTLFLLCCCSCTATIQPSSTPVNPCCPSSRCMAYDHH